MLVILIARVSDVEQRKALPAQKLRLENYANQNKYIFEYHQFDETAHKTDPRKKFQELIENIKSQKERSIVVHDKIDRFTRDSSQEEVKTLNDLVRQDRIELHFPSDNLFITKYSPAADLFRLGIGMALAKYYSDSIRDNVKRRFEQMLNDKIWVGCAPIGYVNINKGTEKKPDKDIVIDKTRAHHIVKMFERRATGLPYEHIAKAANEDGLRGKTHKANKLNKSAVDKILSNPFYYGKMKYMGKEYPHKYEPLITYNLFKQCQEVRKQRQDTRTTYDSIAFAFKDNVKCKKCGCTVSCFYARNNVYLKCSGAKGKCGNQNTAMKLVMPDVVELIKSVPLSADDIPKVIAELKSRHNNQQEYYTQKIEATRTEYDKIKERLKALTYERLDGRITTDLYDEIVTELTARQMELDERLMTLTHSNKSFIVTISYLIDLSQRSSELFKNSRALLQQKMLKLVLSNMVLDDKKLSYIVNDPYRTFIEASKKPQNGANDKIWCG